MDFKPDTHRLRRTIVWSLLVELNRTSCFRCEKEMSIDTYSIDHVVPWRPNSKELFESLKNIAWSHRSCNSSASRPNRELSPEHREAIRRARFKASLERRKIGPLGYAWCTRHQKFLPDDAFSKNKNRWNGLAIICRECRSLSRSRSVVHGTETSYNIYRCRCIDCTTAARNGRNNRRLKLNGTATPS